MAGSSRSGPATVGEAQGYELRDNTPQFGQGNINGLQEYQTLLNDLTQLDHEIIDLHRNFRGSSSEILQRLDSNLRNTVAYAVNPGPRRYNDYDQLVRYLDECWDRSYDLLTTILNDQAQESYALRLIHRLWSIADPLQRSIISYGATASGLDAGLQAVLLRRWIVLSYIKTAVEPDPLLESVLEWNQILFRIHTAQQAYNVDASGTISANPAVASAGDRRAGAANAAVAPPGNRLEIEGVIMVLLVVLTIIELGMSIVCVVEATLASKDIKRGSSDDANFWTLVQGCTTQIIGLVVFNMPLLKRPGWPHKAWFPCVSVVLAGMAASIPLYLFVAPLWSAAAVAVGGIAQLVLTVMVRIWDM